MTEIYYTEEFRRRYAELPLEMVSDTAEFWRERRPSSARSS
jgi:hypothetical protein